MPIRISCFFCVLLLSISLSGQVDVSQYSNQGLFKVEPVIIGKEVNEDLSFSQENFGRPIFETGLKMWDEGKLEDALYFFNTLSDQFPEIPQPFHFAGGVLYELRKYGEATKAFQTALNLDPFFHSSKYMIGVIQLEQGNLVKAQETMESLLQFPDYQATAYYGLGLVRLASTGSKRLTAQKMFEKTIEVDSMFMDAYLRLATINYHQRKPKKALAILNKAVLLSPDWQEAIIARAMLSVEIEDNTDQFEKDIAHLIQLDPTNYHYLSMRGFLSIEHGNYEKGLLDIRQALSIRDTTATSGFRFVSTLTAEKELKEILNYYYSSMSDLVPEARNYITRGICELIQTSVASKRPTLPLLYFDSASVHTSHPIIDYLKATALRVAGEVKKSLNAYSTMIKNDPRISMTYLLRGDMYFNQKKYDSAHMDYTAYINLNKRDRIGYEKRGLLLFERKSYLKAYQDFSRVISISPDNHFIIYKRALCASELNEFEESNYDLDLALSKGFSQKKEAYFFKYRNSLFLHDSVAALGALDSASFYDKHNLKLHLDLVRLGMRMNSSVQVLNGYERLIKYDHTNYKWYFARGKWHFSQGDFQQAFFDIKRLAKQNQKNGEVCYYYGQTLIKIGYTKEGNRWLKRSRKLRFKPPDG